MKKRQQGAALVVTLVILVVALMLGISSMQSALLGESFSGNYRAAVQAQMAAEDSASEALSEFMQNPESIEFYPATQKEDFLDWSNFDAYSPKDTIRGDIRERYIYINLMPESGNARMRGKYIVAMASIISGDQVVARSEPIFVRLTSMAALNMLGGVETADISHLTAGNFAGGGNRDIPSITMTDAHQEHLAALDSLSQSIVPDGVEAISETVTSSFAANLYEIYKSYRNNNCGFEYLLFIPSPNEDEVDCAPPQVGEGAVVEGVVIITHGDLDLHGISEVRGAVIVANVSEAIARGGIWLPEDFEAIDSINLAEGTAIHYDQAYLDEAARQLGDAGQRLFIQGGFSAVSWK